MLFVGYFLTGSFYFLLSFTQSSVLIALLFIFKALGDSQISGALESWFDSNYSNLDNNFDSERTAYSFFNSRLIASLQAISVPTFILGGVLAFLISRDFVLFIQGIGNVGISIGCLLLLKNYSNGIIDSKPLKNNSESSYLTIFFKGWKFLFSSSRIFIFIIGIILIGALTTIWMRLIVLFIYFGYTGNDATAGLF